VSIIVRRCIDNLTFAAYMAVSFITFFQIWGFLYVLSHCIYGFMFCALLFNFVIYLLYIVMFIKGDQKFSVYLMIAIQKVTINVQNVPPPVSKHLLTRRTVFSKTVFSLARSAFQLYSVMFKIFLRVFCSVIIKRTKIFYHSVYNYCYLIFVLGILLHCVFARK
jgi:hypothetical protein